MVLHKNSCGLCCFWILSLMIFVLDDKLWRQRFKPPRLFEFHEGEAKLLCHCLKLLCSSSLLLPLQNTFSPASWASSEDVNRAPGSGLSVKRLYTLSSCCCVYLIISLLSFFQLCPPKFAMPLDLRPYPLRHFPGSVFPRISAILSSLFLHWRFFSRRDRVRLGLRVQSLWNTGVCLMSVPFFASTPLFLHYHPSHISSGTAFYTTFTCFNRLPLLLCSTVGHSAPHFSTHQSIIPNFAIYCSFFCSNTTRPPKMAAVSGELPNSGQSYSKWDFYDTVSDLNYSNFNMSVT